MPPDEFVELVRDALQHLYDLPHLQTHALVGTLGVPAARGRGNALRQALIDAIDSLQTGSQAPADSRSWRTYRILEHRYIEGRSVPDVMSEVALGKTQYHREHQRALTAVASLLWERWGCAERWWSRGERPPAPPGQRSSPVGWTELAEVLRGVARLVEPLCAARGVRLRLDLPEAELPVRGDRVSLRHALLAVLTPGIRLAAESGAGAGAVTLGVAATAAGREVEVVASGGSPGPTDLAQIGILEARSLLGPLSGRVELSLPEPTRWAVRFRLPLAVRRTLLVVDNNADFIRLVERYLADLEWEVVGAGDVDAAEALARTRAPDAILLDVVMPGRDGLDLLVTLKGAAATAPIPVFVCSVLHEADVATSLGAAAYLQKPITQAELIGALEAEAAVAPVR